VNRRAIPSATLEFFHMSFRARLVSNFWQYTKKRQLKDYLDGSTDQKRPPVFAKGNETRNIIYFARCSDPQRAMLSNVIPARKRQKWFRSMNSSQALAQSVFGNLMVHSRIDLLRSICSDDGEPLISEDPIHCELEFEVDYLSEPRPTSIDVFFKNSDGYRVAFECKFIESDIGLCSRPDLTSKDANYESDHCDGNYTHQRSRTSRCSLTNVGVAYWNYVPKLFSWASDIDHIPCPLASTYQLARNILAVSVDSTGTHCDGQGHVVLVYDERNPAFQTDGAGAKAYANTQAGLRDPRILRKCSWQTIMQRLENDAKLAWLTSELKAKYGF
jgi:hypothetical protein